MITTYLDNLKRFRVALGPDEREQIVAQTIWESVGITEYAAEQGRALNAQKVVIGTVDRLGTDIVVTASVVDVKTISLQGSRQIRCRSCSERDLIDGSEMLGPMIAR
jgi:hypothetical protein